MFKGISVALATPFIGGAVDFKKLERLINFQLESGINGFVICSSTGEGLSLTKSERLNIIKLARKIIKNVPLLVGCSCASIHDVIAEAQMAEEQKLDGILVPPPFYIKPTQAGIIEYYKQIIANTKLPVIMYNIPGRCSVTLEIDTISTLVKTGRIVGLKDSTRNFENLTELHYYHPELTILSGDDITLPACLAHGGSGAISALANVAPKLISTIKTDFEKFKLIILSKALGVTTNPISLKYIAKKYKAELPADLDLGELRLPLMEVSKTEAAKIDNILAQCC